MNQHVTSLLAAGLLAAPALAGDRPDVVIFMADDMGYSDIAPYGGEIDTPNLTNLANNGTRYTQFYNTSRCSPSRASLLTGRYSHAVGMGQLNNNRGLPGYQGQIHASTPTIAEVMSDNGYRTFMVGKWHMSRSNNTPNGSWPHQRGFDFFHGTMEGAKNYFNPPFFRDIVTNPDGTQTVNFITEFAEDYFYTVDMSETAAGYIRDAAPEDDLFVYVAFYGPHFPLQAPADQTQKYLDRGDYENGWDPIRQARLDRQIQMGVSPPGTQLSPRAGGVPDWNTLSTGKKNDMNLRMSVYAAQVDMVDQGVGRVLSALADTGRLDNTLIFFLSDNGGQGGPSWDGNGSNVGTPQAPVQTKIGDAWSNVSNAPFRLFKGYNHEGGIASPFIIHWPDGTPQANRGRVDTATRGHISDIVPTIIDVTNVTFPGQAPGELPPEFESMPLTDSVTNAQTVGADRLMFWEHEGKRGASNGEYKVVAAGSGRDWELYKIDEDRNEQDNLIESNQPMVEELVLAWEAWAERNNVLPWPWSNPYQPYIPPTPRPDCDLLSHLTFDEESMTDGDTIADSGPNGFHGLVDTKGDTAEHSVATGVAGLGNAFDFNEDIVDIDIRTVVPRGSEPRTIALWVNPDDVGSTKRVLGYGNPDGTDAATFILTFQDDPNNATINLRYDGTVVTYVRSVFATPLRVGSWGHVAIVVPDDATTTTDVEVYLNGVPLQGSVTSGSDRVLITGASLFGVGMKGNVVPGGYQATNWFDGQIADIQFYNSALTSQQVRYLRDNPGKALPLVQQGCCAPDLAEPFDTLDIDDVLTFLGGFSSSDPVADLADPTGIFDIDDVLTFLVGFSEGCP